jgi:hypothetical protein
MSPSRAAQAGFSPENARPHDRLFFAGSRLTSATWHRKIHLTDHVRGSTPEPPPCLDAEAKWLGWVASPKAVPPGRGRWWSPHRRQRRGLHSRGRSFAPGRRSIERQQHRNGRRERVPESPGCPSFYAVSEATRGEPGGRGLVFSGAPSDPSAGQVDAVEATLGALFEGAKSPPCPAAERCWALSIGDATRPRRARPGRHQREGRCAVAPRVGRAAVTTSTPGRRRRPSVTPRRDRVAAARGANHNQKARPPR